MANERIGIFEKMTLIKSAVQVRKMNEKESVMVIFETVKMSAPTEFFNENRELFDAAEFNILTESVTGSEVRSANGSSTMELLLEIISGMRNFGEIQKEKLVSYSKQIAILRPKTLLGSGTETLSDFVGLCTAAISGLPHEYVNMLEDL